jgi:hypothetical protein
LTTLKKIDINNKLESFISGILANVFALMFLCNNLRKEREKCYNMNVESYRLMKGTFHPIEESIGAALIIDSCKEYILDLI